MDLQCIVEGMYMLEYDFAHDILLKSEERLFLSNLNILIYI